MIEKAAPFVVGDDEHGRAPLRAADDRIVGAGEERLTCPDVGERVVVPRKAALAALAEGIDEGDVREAAGSAVTEEVGVRAEDAVVRATPVLQERLAAPGVAASRQPARA